MKKSIFFALFLGVLFAAPKIAETTLSNGIEVFSRASNNEIVGLVIFVRGGAMNLTNETQGIEKLLLKTMLKGSANYPQDRLLDLQTKIQTEYEAKVGYDYSTIQMKCLRQYWDESLTILADLIRNPLLLDSDIKKVKQNLLTDVAERHAQPDNWIYHLANRDLLKNHPYKNHTGGTKETLESFKREDLLAHYESIFQGSQILIAVVGKIGPSELYFNLDDAFDWMAKGDYTIALPPPFEQKEKTSVQFEQREIPTNYVLGKYISPNLHHEDYLSLRVGTYILHDRFFKRLRTELHLTYSIRASLTESLSPYGSIYITTTEPERAVPEMMNVIQDMIKNPVSQKEIIGTAETSATYNLMREQSVVSQAVTLGRYEIVGTGWEQYYELLDDAATISPEQISIVFERYFQNYMFGVVGNNNWTVQQNWSE